MVRKRYDARKIKTRKNNNCKLSLNENIRDDVKLFGFLRFFQQNWFGNTKIR